MDRLTLLVRNQRELLESLASSIRRRGFTLFDQECVAASEKGLFLYRFWVARGTIDSGYITIETLIEELEARSDVESVRHERHSDLDSSILSRSTSIALAISGAYPDIISLYRDFDGSLEPEHRDLAVLDLGEKVGNLLIRHRFPGATSIPNLTWGIEKIALQAIRPFAIAQAAKDSLSVIACPFCRELEVPTVHCGFLVGLFTALLGSTPGFRAAVEEVECRARGDRVCKFDFSWHKVR